MTERSLLVRCANLGPYCIIGTDYPSARVFDSRRSALVSVVEEPQRSRLVNTSSAFATTLTSVALGTQARTSNTTVSDAAKGKKKSTSTVTNADEEALEVFYAAMGLSNGTLVLHNVTHDERIDHIAVCETQHALIALVFEGPYLFCLSANCFLYVVDLARRQCVLRAPCQADASSLAVSSATSVAPGQELFRVLVSGPTMTLHEVSLQRSTEGEDGQQVRRGVCRKLLSFASQGSRVDFSWLSKHAFAASTNAGAVAAVTASAQEGTIRIWDVREDHTKSSATESASRAASVLIGRCRRTLLCGQRMANISVLEGRTHCFVAATTVTGSLLLWDLASSLLPIVAEATPIAPHYVFVSENASATAANGRGTTPRLLYGAILQASASSTTHAEQDVACAQLRLLLLHGRFALPRFSAVQVGNLLESHRTRCDAMSPQEVRARAADAASRAALGFFHNSASPTEAPATEVVALPAISDAGQLPEDVTARSASGSDAAFATADSVWLHQRQQLAAKAAATPTESFRAMHTVHAASMKDLPVKQMTLEQRLRRLANEAASASAVHAKYGTLARSSEASGEVATDADGDGMLAQAEALDTFAADEDRRHATSLGLATVPLYQALHAGDSAAVMELLTVAGRSPDGMKATVLSLQLPYVLQLLKVLSERLGIVSNRTTKSTSGHAAAEADEALSGGGRAAVSTRSPLLAWVDAIVRYRGMEMYATQLALGHQAAQHSQPVEKKKNSTEEAEEDEEGGAGDASKTEQSTAEPTAMSPPRDFLAPILHQYRAVCGQYDKLAVLYGRMSIFNAVRPSERSAFVNRAPPGSANSNLELVRDGRQRRNKIAGTGASSEAALKLRKLYGHGDVLAEDIAFPANFKEVRTYKGGSRVVRVRSRVARDKRQHAQINSDRALLRRARQMAAEKNKSGGGGGLLDSDNDDGEEDDMMMQAMLEANDGEVDLDALEENMRLDSEGDDEEGDDDEEEDDDDSGHARKRARQERRGERTTSDVMLADDTRPDGDGEEDQDAMELDSSEAEFSAGSDDDVHSEVLDFSDDDEKGSSSSSEDDNDENNHSEDDGDEEGNGAVDGDDSGDDEADEDDGMGDAMKALIEEEGLESAADRRKHKRVRLD